MKLKYITTLMIAALISTAALSQSTKEINVDGLKVIFRHTPKEVISVRLYIKGGTANYTKDKEGIEELAFAIAMNGGTKKMDKVTFNDAAEKIGTSFGSMTSLDYGNLSMTCLKPYWNESWNLFADAVMNPAFDAKEFELEKEKALSGAKQRESDADGSLNIIAMESTFQGRNYAKLPDGSVASIEKLTLDDVSKYYKSIVTKGRAYLVVVGDLSENDIIGRVRESLSKLPIGTQPKVENKLLITKGSVEIIDRDIATNYLMGIMSAPSLNSDEGVQISLAMRMLYDRFFVELRTKRSLSYAPAAGYNSGAITSPYSYVYITTTDPKAALNVMVAIIDSVKKNGFTEKELKDMRQKFLTNYYQKLETSEAQSGALGRSEAAGSWKMDDAFTEKINSAKLKDINNTFNKYTAAIKWSYLGKKDAVTKDDFKQTKHEKGLESPY
ncbi:MAG TPA: pitrilysin family protein [Bacteroidia bacterium]|nr:putative zinc protease [Bacteroidia bacterium]MBX3105654.1 insulinase family protein [Bacteroidota bacterium]MCE7955426.1 insulinase family protein [Bacteroidetes bacterium CHB6]MCB8930836.1 insulinase family protein [Bacteroidia bacterium]MCO5288318.1 insulinase family protein [Bacteroidota bacterium]